MRARLPDVQGDRTVAVSSVDDRAAVDAEQVSVPQALTVRAAVHDDLVRGQAQHAVNGVGAQSGA
jgi:hypothetical protein